ncbi:MAG: AAA family ATPase [Thermoguttaceae bacterium]|nr:AAA family ATPase [Thermoguttaceae bacterium]
MSVNTKGLLLARKMADIIDLLGYQMAAIYCDRSIFKQFRSCCKGTSFEFDINIFENLRKHQTSDFIEQIAKYRLAIGFTALVHFALYADDIIEEDEIEVAYPILRPLAFVLGTIDSDLSGFRNLSRRDTLPFLNAFASLQSYKNDLLTLTNSLTTTTEENQIGNVVRKNAQLLGRENRTFTLGHLLSTLYSQSGNPLSDLLISLLSYLFSRGMVLDHNEARRLTPAQLAELGQRYKPVELIKMQRYVSISMTMAEQNFAIMKHHNDRFPLKLRDFLRKQKIDETTIFDNQCFSPEETSAQPQTNPPVAVPVPNPSPKGGSSVRNNTSPVSQSSPKEMLKEALKELEGLEGLNQVKTEVKKFVAMLTVQQERQKHGMEVPTRSLHYIFYGNPGTGKTTVARILAKIFYGFGLLKSNKLTECSRADLVGGYTGQTAIKTKEVVESALDGVLFIDEAYMLSNSNKNDDSFGQEAIDTLLKLMEDNRERLIVIAAGYPDLMNEFLASNPGMKSRFTRFLHFEDYGVPELCHIMERMSKKVGITLSPAACVRVSILLAQLHRIKDKTFGNARLVRNIFENTLSNQAVRLAALGSIPKKLLTVFEGEDVPEEMSPVGNLDPAGVRWKVTCPGCGNSAAVNADLLGRPIKCRCSQKFTCPWDNPILPPPPKPQG